MLALILAPPVAPAHLELRAAPLSRALPKLGEAYGVPMRAAPAIGDEIAVFSLKGVALPDLKERIAETFAAEWRVETDGTLVLNRSAKLRAAEERAFFAQRRASVTKALAELGAEVRKAPILTREVLQKACRVYDEAKRKGVEPDESDFPFVEPAHRLLWGVVSKMSPDEFVRLSDRIVYSNRPNAMQRPFPTEVAPLLRLYQEEEKNLEAMTPVVSEGTFPEESEPLEPRGPVQTLLLTVATEPDYLSAEMTGYDAAGRLVLVQELESWLLGGNPLDGVAKTLDAPSTDPNDPAYPFPASAETRAFIEALGNGLAVRGNAEPPNRESAREFLDVVEREPLSFAYSDIVFEASRLMNRSVIARPRDEGILAGLVAGSEKSSKLSAALCVERLNLSNPGWLLVRPEFPYRANLGFFPRPELRSALQAAYNDGRFSLETAMRIAELTPDRGTEPPLHALTNRLSFTRTFLNLRLLRVLASLGPAGRARAGGGVRFAELPPAARQRIERLVFGPEAMSIRKNDPVPGTTTLAPAQGIEAEPTMLLPNGIPPDARVSVVTSEADGVAPVDPSLNAGRPVTMEALATRIFQARNPRLFSPDIVQDSNPWNLARLRRSGREITTFRIDLTPLHNLMAAHTATALPSGPEFTISSLPPDLRAAFDRAMAVVEVRYKDAPPYEPSAGDAPPPAR